MLSREMVAIRELTKLLDRLSASATAALPAILQYRAMQRQQTWELAHLGEGFESKIILSAEAVTEINVVDLESSPDQKKVLVGQSTSAYNVIRCHNAEMGRILSRNTNRGFMALSRETVPYKCFKAAEFAILTFT